MITNGFTYIAVLVFLAACLIGAQKVTKSKFFDFVPPIVLLYLIAMLCCTFGVWNTGETKAAYDAVRNPILYAMIFLMLLRFLHITTLSFIPVAAVPALAALVFLLSFAVAWLLSRIPFVGRWLT